MDPQDLILKKRNGGELSGEEIDFLVKGIVDGSIPDYQTSAWAMAVFFRGMSEKETNQLAITMAYSGDVMDLSAIEGYKVDKHSSGGVGDKTTLVVVPLAAAAGVPVAKMSGRGLGHTGGTIDKFESIPGFQVERSYWQLVEQVNKVRAAVVAQSGNLVPADKKLYAIRDVTATIDSIPLIAASIMSKKIAAGAQGIVLDVKVGNGAFMKNLGQAADLAQTMMRIGRGAGKQVVAILTDMNQPLGHMVGNALEVKEAIDLLKGNGPDDLRDLCTCLTAHMLQMAGVRSSYGQAAQLVQELLHTGAGLAKFRQMVAAQGGELDYERPGYGLPQAMINAEVRAEQSGYVASIDTERIGRTAMRLGAGRDKIGEPIDPSVGVEVIKKLGDRVSAGEALARIYANDQARIESACRAIMDCYHLEESPPEQQSLILQTFA